MSEKLAKRFHEIYEATAPQFGYVTNKESACMWEDVPPMNKALMVSVATQIKDEFLNNRHLPPEVQAVIEAAKEWADFWIQIFHDEPGEIDLFNAIRALDK